MYQFISSVSDKILEFFEFKQFNWPQISDKKDLEKFMNILAKKYHVSKVNVHIEAEEWIRDWSQSKRAIACAWRQEGELNAAFSVSLFREIRPNILILQSRKKRKFMHAILHEFVHLFLRENFPWIEESHGPDFVWWESRLALEYGLKVKRRKGISYV